MQSRFLLHVVVCEGPVILELLACKDETLLLGGDSLLILNLRLYICNSIT